jgi:class 3 adenylate cyclase
VTEQQAKTWLCTVVFLDIAGYTQRSMTRQVNAKGHLQLLIEDAVSDTPESDRTIIDTGDGAALCYLGDPERALLAAIHLRESLVQPTSGDIEPVQVRIGINLGPVRFVRSLNGQLNPLGDGINNSQRVMAFADPNQILVSRSFYDVIACLSKEYAQLFGFVGARRDKHGKEHELYELRMASQPEVMVTRRVTSAIIERTQAIQRPPVPDYDPDMLRRAEVLLTEYVGPVARVLVKKAAERACSTGEFGRLVVDAVPLEAHRHKILEALGMVDAATTPSPGHQTTEPVITGGTRALDSDVLRKAEEQLAIFLGPLAKLLVKRTAKKTSDRQHFYQLLAGELATPEERATFLESMQNDG